MIQLVKHGFGAEAFRQRVDLFCFTDIRLDITPRQSMRLQEQLLRLSDLFTGIITTYIDTDNTNRYNAIAIKSRHLAKRFGSIHAALTEQGIDEAPLALFKQELATEVYNDCVKLNDTDLYDALNSFLKKRERHGKQPRPNEPEINN